MALLFADSAIRNTNLCQSKNQATPANRENLNLRKLFELDSRHARALRRVVRRALRRMLRRALRRAVRKALRRIVSRRNIKCVVFTDKDATVDILREPVQRKVLALEKYVPSMEKDVIVDPTVVREIEVAQKNRIAVSLGV